MKVITIQGSDSEIKKLKKQAKKLGFSSSFKISKTTLSEKQLKHFLKFKHRGGFKMSLSLKCSGDSVISLMPLNLCTVKINKNEYLFGGISELFYDKMVKKYHTEI